MLRDQKYQKIVHDNIFDIARNRARSHDKIFIVKSNSLSLYFSLPHGGPENDRERRDLSFERLDRDDPCKGMKQIITGFSKWSERYISSCPGQKNYSHQTKRMTKWGRILRKGKG